VAKILWCAISLAQDDPTTLHQALFKDMSDLSTLESEDYLNNRPWKKYGILIEHCMATLYLLENLLLQRSTAGKMIV
jgi:hypothetical protein